MPLTRSQSQGKCDLFDHYADSDEYRDDLRKSNAEMRCLVTALDQALPKTTVWGLTSHFRLLLMSTPLYDSSEPHVLVYHYCNQFWVEYYPPDGDLPVHGSHVGFRVNDVTDAVRQILVAMGDSKGWPGSPELQ